MNLLRYALFISVFVLLNGLSLGAQSNDTILVHIPEPQPVESPKPVGNKKVSKAGKITPSYYRHHKKLPAIYSGFGIQLTTSDLPLKRDYFLFKQFGNIHYEKLDEGGYAYVLLVKFSSKKALENYITQVILPKAPEALPLVYKNGICKRK